MVPILAAGYGADSKADSNRVPFSRGIATSRPPLV
jgi:hypothetical protein